MPIMNEAGRTARIAAAVNAALGSPATTERVSIHWNGRPIQVEVVYVPLDSVVLNPKSHRIKAELESHPMRAEVDRNPFSEAAQRVIADLLRKTEGYADLKANLEADGQRDYGVTTRAGVLVNANTRAVALRELGVVDIKVAVLPSDADQPSIENLEAHLQVKRDYRQPYSFPNELLFIQDLTNRGRSDEDIARDLGWATSDSPMELRKGVERVAQSRRILSLLVDVSGRSGGRVPLTAFTGARQALVELDNEVEKLKSRDPRAANRLRDLRMLAILANVGYREIRNIDDTLLKDYLPEAFGDYAVLADIPLTAPPAATVVEDAGEADDLALFVDPVGASPEEETLDYNGILDALLHSHGSDSILLPGSTEPVERTEVVDALEQAFRIAGDDYRADKTAGGQAAATVKMLSDATKKVNKVTSIVNRVRHDGTFPARELNEAVAVLGRSIQALRTQLSLEQPRLDG